MRRLAGCGGSSSICAAGGNDHLSGTLDVFARVVDRGVGANGAEKRVERDGGFGVAFEDVFEKEAEIAFAAAVEAGGEGVAVDGGFGDAVVELEGRERFPVEEGLLDIVAILAAADGAFALVAFESGRNGGSKRGFRGGGCRASAGRGDGRRGGRCSSVGGGLCEGRAGGGSG